jgi:hypothetical protein
MTHRMRLESEGRTAVFSGLEPLTQFNARVEALIAQIRSVPSLRVSQKCSIQARLRRATTPRISFQDTLTCLKKVATEYDLQKLLPVLLVAGLENDGVDRGFDVPGEENLDVVESLRDSSIKLVFARVWDRPVVAGFQRSAGLQASRIERAG